MTKTFLRAAQLQLIFSQHPPWCGLFLGDVAVTVTSVWTVMSVSQWRQWDASHCVFPNFPTTETWVSASFYDFTKNGVLCCSEASFGCYIRISKGPSDNKSVHRRRNRNRDRLLHLYDACLNRNGFRSLKGISGSGQSARKGFVSSQPWFVWDLVICKTWGNGISKQMRKVRESERECACLWEWECVLERGQSKLLPFKKNWGPVCRNLPACKDGNKCIYSNQLINFLSHS